MPNWCFTHLTVSGPAQDIQRFADGLEAGKKEGNYSILDTYFPCPEDLNITSGFFSDPEKQAQMNALYAANREKYGHESWYDWNITNYGSKWADHFGEYDRDETDRYHVLRFQFDTAWSPITEGIRFVSSLFPTLVFAMSYDEEAGFYVGAEVHKAGETLFFQQEEPPSPDQKDDEDDQDWYDRIDEARHEARWAIEEEADKVEGRLLLAL